MKRLLSLAKFSSHHHLERLIVECARNNDMQVKNFVFYASNILMMKNHQMIINESLLHTHWLRSGHHFIKSGLPWRLDAVTKLVNIYVIYIDTVLTQSLLFFWWNTFSGSNWSQNWSCPLRNRFKWGSKDRDFWRPHHPEHAKWTGKIREFCMHYFPNSKVLQKYSIYVWTWIIDFVTFRIWF